MNLPAYTINPKEVVVTDDDYVIPFLFEPGNFGRKALEYPEPDKTSSPTQNGEEDTVTGKWEPQPHDIPIVSPPVVVRAHERFEVLQWYKGIVLSTNQDCFWARLENNTDSTQNDEEAEFPLDEISYDDRKLVRNGAVFYWYIGYHDSASGQRTRQSVIRFRRLPALRRDDIEKAREKAIGLMRKLGSGSGEEQLGGP